MNDKIKSVLYAHMYIILPGMNVSRAKCKCGLTVRESTEYKVTGIMIDHVTEELLVVVNTPTDIIEGEIES